MDSRELVSGVLELCVREGRDIHSTQWLEPRSAEFHVAYFPLLSLIADLGSGVIRYPGLNVSLFANCRACAVMSKHAGCDGDGLCRPKIGYCASRAAACAWLPPRRVTSPHVLFCLSCCVLWVWGGFCSPLSRAQISFHRSALAGRSFVSPVLLFGTI